MILAVDSDAACLVAPEARSRAGGFHHLGNRDGSMLNGSVAVIAKIIKNVMASAAEAEVGAAGAGEPDKVQPSLCRCEV